MFSQSATLHRYVTPQRRRNGLIASTRRTRLIVDASAPDDLPGPAPGTDRTPSLIRPPH